MKKTILIVLALFLSTFNYSQSPEKFTYQSIVRSADGNILKASSLGIKLSVLKGTKNGIAVYSETHSTATNNNGLVTLIIGDGTSSDNFTDIDWSTGEYFLKVEVDPAGGINYSIEQTSQLLSVPYALYATRASGVDLTKDVKGVLPVAEGGTGSSTSPMIGLVTAPNASVAKQMLGITPISLGGTGSTTAPMIGVVTATDAAAAKKILGISDSGGGKVVLAAVTDNYLTIKDVANTPGDQEITAGIVPVSLGGTGSTTAPMVGVVTAADASASRDSLGLGTIAIQNKDAMDIDGGAIDGTAIGANTTSTGAFNSVSSGLYQSIGDTDVIIKTGNEKTGNITLQNGADGNIHIAPDGSGKVVLDDLTFPAADGTAGQVLKTDGSGNLSWIAVDTAGKDNSTAVTLATVTDNYLTLSGQEITSGTVPISLGGTGSTTAPMVGVVTAADPAAARTVLEIDKSGTDNSTAVTLATVTDNYLTLSGQEITSGTVPVSLGGTGSTTAPMVGVVTAADASASRDSLGLGTIAIQNKDAMDIDGGAIDGTAIGANTTSTGAFNSVSSGLYQSIGDTDVIIKTGNEKTGNITLQNGADSNINITPNGTGNVVIPSLKLDTTVITANGAELNILDGVTSTTAEINILNKDTPPTTTTVVAGDQLILNDISLGTMKQVALPDVATYLQSVFDVDGLTDAKKAGTNFTGSMLIGNETPGTLDDNDAATYNLGVGETALDALTTGDNNIALGYDALKANTTGTKNIAIGKGALDAAVAQSNNIAIGYDALGGTNSGGTNGGGEYNVAIGNNTLTATLGGGDKQGQYNVAVGDNALSANTTGSYNTATGSWALNANTTGTGNTAIGEEALEISQTGNWNTAIGLQTLEANVSGSGNTAIGSEALKANTASWNTAIGLEALQANVSGSGNTAVGSAALEANVSGSGNTAIGTDALQVNTGSYNTAIGTEAQTENTTGTRNIAIGYAAYTEADAENDNLAIGYYALGGAVNGAEYNVAIGNYTLDNALEGDYNVAVGYKALTDNTTGANNSSLGSNSLKDLIGGDGNTAIGYNSAQNITNGNYNVSIGNHSSNANLTGDDNVAVGNSALYSNQSNDNTAVGFNALYNTNAANNVGIGWKAGNEITSGTDNVVIGYNASVGSDTANNQIVIGSGVTGKGVNTVTIGNGDILTWSASDDNKVSLGSSGVQFKDLYINGVAYTDAIGFGTTAVPLPTSAGANTQILALNASNELVWVNNSGVAGGVNDLSDGEVSGSDNSSVGLGTTMGSGNSKRNTALGISAMSDYTADDAWGHNTAIGYSALKKLTSGTDNTAVGNEIGAHSGAPLTGSNNTMVGSQASLGLTTGSNNTVVGKRAGEIVTTGDENILIGVTADVNSGNADAQNQIVIGYNADGIGDDKAVIGNNDVTDVYMAQDGEATVHAAGITFSDGTSQTTAASGFTHNQVIAASETDTSVELAIGKIKVRIDAGYLQAKGDGQNVTLALFAKIYPGGSAAWNSYGENVWFGAESGYTFSNGTWRDLIEESTRGDEYENSDQDAKLDTYGMIVVEAYESDYTSPHKNNYYRITAWKGGWGKVYLRGEHYTYADYSP